MAVLLLSLLLQAPPALEELSSVELPDGGPWRLLPSRAGKFLLAAGEKNVHVLQAGSLKPLAFLAGSVSTAGFDEGDATVTLVGEKLRRLAVEGWGEAFAVEVPDVAPGPELAMISSDGIVYYRNRDGWISSAIVAEGHLEAGPFQRQETDQGRQITRFWGADGATLLVSTDRHAGLFLRGRYFQLTPPDDRDALLLAPAPDGLRLVTRGAAGRYLPQSFKLAGRRAEPGLLSAAVDPKSGWLFLSGGEGLRALDPGIDRPVVYDAVKAPFTRMAVDPVLRVLYGGSGNLVRSWRIKDGARPKD